MKHESSEPIITIKRSLISRLCLFPILTVRHYFGSISDAILYTILYIAAPLWIVFQNYYGFDAEAAGWLTSDNFWAVMKTLGTIVVADIVIFFIWQIGGRVFEGFVRKMQAFKNTLIEVWKKTEF